MWLSRFLVVLIVFALCVSAEAQQKNVPRIGFLSATSLSTISARTNAFRQGLRDLGYVEGKDIVIEWRYAEGKMDRLPDLASELVRLKVDIIVTGGPAATRPAKEATVSIPIVMAFDTDPVGNGFVASLARPGANITGLSVLAPELSGKQLELLKEIVPKLSRVAFIGSSSEPGVTQALRETKHAAGVLGVRLQYMEIRDSRDVATAFQETRKAHAQALLILQLPILASQRAHIADLALKNQMPAIYGQPEYMDVGGLLYYGASINDMFRRAAAYVDKILKGRKPADLPVEQPTKFELVINLKAAKQIGLTIPPSVLARADKVIR
jgi:putative ABC transport system substrate-binding protein